MRQNGEIHMYPQDKEFNSIHTQEQKICRRNLQQGCSKKTSREDQLVNSIYVVDAMMVVYEPFD